MADTLADFLPLAGSATSDQQSFYGVIREGTHSRDCHLSLLELFMNALAMASSRYRAQTFMPLDRAPHITTEAQLDTVLGYLPDELRPPLTQVLFENWARSAVTGNNAWYVSTNPASIATAFQQVLAVNCAIELNDLISEYAAKGWAAPPPDPIAKTTPTNAPTIPELTAKIVELKAWILKYDRYLVALGTLKAQPDAATILTNVFGQPLVPDIDTLEFCMALVGQIYTSNVLRVAVSAFNGKGGITVFLEACEASLKTEGMWITKPDVTKLRNQFIAKSADVWRSNTPEAISIVRQMFQIALTWTNAADLATARATIGSIFTVVNAATQSVNSAYLMDQLTATCSSLTFAASTDLARLDEWVGDFNAAVPGSIPGSHLNSLMSAVTQVLAGIPLAYPAQPAFASANLYPFSDYGALKNNSTVCRFPWGQRDSDTFIVDADAAEDEGTGEQRYYRPCYGVFDEAIPAYLKFFNIGGAKVTAGEFFFVDAAYPSLVRTWRRSSPGTPLRFDLDAATIDGSTTISAGVISGVAGGSPYRRVTGRSVSNSVLYAALRAISKWTNFQGQRTYDVLYATRPDNAPPNAHLVWRTGAGDLNRADAVDESLCCWYWAAPLEIKKKYPQLSRMLGLPPARSLEPDGPLRLAGTRSGLHGLGWRIATVTVQEDAADATTIAEFVATNTPLPSLPAQLDLAMKRASPVSKPLGNDAADMMRIFDFAYYRKITKFAGKDKVIKYLPALHRPSDAGDGVMLGDVGQADGKEALGVDLPVSFRIPNNLTTFKSFTGSAGTASASIKNKGNPLYRAQNKRLGAGAVMAKLRGQLAEALAGKPPGSKSSLPATAFGAWVLAKSPAAIAGWQTLKESKGKDLPADQEWCHLLGHGDGGDERLGNFVSGSFHCNTEQLAMESKGRRKVTHSAQKGSYELRATAYLFNNNDALFKGNYLASDGAYQKMLRIRAALRAAQGKPIAVSGAGTVAPLAAFIRYKMLGNGPDYDPRDGSGSTPVPSAASRIKLFDHIFEGQSEFIDLHQFTILQHAAWFAVAGKAAFERWYKENEEVAMDAAVANGV